MNFESLKVEKIQTEWAKGSNLTTSCKQLDNKKLEINKEPEQPEPATQMPGTNPTELRIDTLSETSYS